MNANNRTWNILWSHSYISFNNKSWLMRGTLCRAVRSTMVLKQWQFCDFGILSDTYKEILYPLWSKTRMNVWGCNKCHIKKSPREKKKTNQIKIYKRQIFRKIAYRKKSAWNPTLKAKKCNSYHPKTVLICAHYFTACKRAWNSAKKPTF